MTRAQSSYHVGIDLGTTHTVVAYAARDAAGDSGAPIAVLPLPQLISASEVRALRLLPSFLYAPAASERVADPWQELPWLVGQYARLRGEEVSERLVASGKSWLSHAGVARRGAILPWAADAAEVPKISPVEASRRLLAHVRLGWDEAFCGLLVAGAKRRAHGAGLVRRGRARAHGRSGRACRLPGALAGRTASGILRSDRGRAPQRGGGVARRRKEQRAGYWSATWAAGPRI